MRTTAPRAAGALLLTCALLMAAAPSAAAPTRAASEGPSLFDAIQAWIALWLPGAAPPGSAPEATPTAVGAESQPAGPATTTEDDPLAQPQIGPEADPSG